MGGDRGTATPSKRTDLFELIEFTVVHERPRRSEGDGTGSGDVATLPPPTIFGVNVAKVREVIRLPQIVPCLTLAPEVVGVFNLRGEPIPAIHLARALGINNERILPNDQVIVTEFAQRRAGFIIAGTRRIRRVPQERILPPSSNSFANITGMLLLENSEFLFMLDFEEILLDLEARHSGQPQNRVRMQSDVLSPGRRPRAMVVDDSAVARRAVCDMLADLGLDVIECVDGEEAWQVLQDPSFSNGTERVDVIICDVEMPRLDGYALVERLRTTSPFANLPIIIHSSLTGTLTRDRAREVGANAYVNKLNRREMVHALRIALSLTEQEVEAVS